MRLRVIKYVINYSQVFRDGGKYRLFADDVKAILAYSVIDSQVDFFNLQSANDKLVTWSVERQLKIVDTKCMHDAVFVFKIQISARNVSIIKQCRVRLLFGGDFFWKKRH